MGPHQSPCGWKHHPSVSWKIRWEFRGAVDGCFLNFHTAKNAHLSFKKISVTLREFLTWLAGKSPCLIGNAIFKRSIFHCYVSLLEGMVKFQLQHQCQVNSFLWLKYTSLQLTQQLRPSLKNGGWKTILSFPFGFQLIFRVEMLVSGRVARNFRIKSDLLLGILQPRCPPAIGDVTEFFSAKKKIHQAVGILTLSRLLVELLLL